ncbi:MAG: hypothetical protein SF069_11890 [Phycisphaerae bacterium]|nr:hypothetical protein [Phycisphaerae bacterium]
MSALRERWSALCGRLRPRSGGDLAGAAFDCLIALYDSPRRAYHNLEHIAACLAELDRHGPSAQNRDLIEFALWFHDCIYEPGRAGNETRSAQVARLFGTALGQTEQSLQHVERLILATQHNAPPSDDAESLIIDIDLSILGAEPAIYDAYVAAIRCEYAAADTAQWRAGRGAFLESMLARARIFGSGAARQRLEAPARANLQRELAALDSR